MTKIIEVVDSLPGTGKTTAIFKYMAEDQSRPWLYLSPVKTEITERVKEIAAENEITFVTPDDNLGTLNTQALEMFKEGINVACTHSLTLHFTKEHIHELKTKQYRIVCDEELNLIDTFKISQEDVDFLLHNNHISIDYDNFGKVTFNDQTMSYKASFGTLKGLADRGCLYMTRRSSRMMVVYLSPDLILNSNQFILLTYGFEGSLMHTFMKLFDIEAKKLEGIQLMKDSSEVKAQIRELISFVETPGVLSTQNTQKLSRSWWNMHYRNKNEPKSQLTILKKKISNVIQTSGIPTQNIFITCPSDYFPAISSGRIQDHHFVPCNKRATNELANRNLAIHAYDLYMNVPIKSYLKDYGFEPNDEVFALNLMIQWIFRGSIRNNQKMQLCILSKRMNTLFKNWLIKP